VIQHEDDLSSNATATNDTIAEGLVGPLSDLSDNQEIALSVLQIVSAMLSLIGSSVIVYKIVRKFKKERTTPYERIILGLSSFDILASITYALSPFLLPSETSQRVWAIGTKSTCSLLGFMSQFACFWAVWYNVLLSFYYLLTVRFQVKPKVFATKYELWMHLSGAIFFPITAFLGLWGDWYSEEALTMMCWIGDVPNNCRADGVPCYTQLVAYIFGMIPTAIALISLIINNIVIYLFLRRTLRTKPTIPVVNSETSTEENIENGNSKQEQAKDCREEETLNGKLIREVATQGMLYVAAWLLTIFPALLLSILDAAVDIDESDQSRLFPLLVLNSLLLPLQGFSNVFIYVRPSYRRFRSKNPEKPAWFVLKQALFDPNIPRLCATTATSSMGASKDFRKRATKLPAIVE